MSAGDPDVSQRLFRKVALARLSSPDRMDALIGIGRPLIVLAWLGITIAAITFLVWGFGARIEQKVIGYYSLAAGSLLRARAPGSLRRNKPDPLPVMLLGRLAVDRSCQGKGYGKGLLRDAILRTLHAAWAAPY